MVLNNDVENGNAKINGSEPRPDARLTLESAAAEVPQEAIENNNYILEKLRNLGFDNNPPWRETKGERIDSSWMIEQIFNFTTWYRTLPEKQRNRIIREGILNEFRDYFVLRMATGEDEGVQSLGETHDLGNRARNPSGTGASTNGLSHRELATFNMYRALELTNRLTNDAKEVNTGFMITEQMLSQWHQKLWENVVVKFPAPDPHPGELRAIDSPATVSDGGHYYPNGADVTAGMQSFVNIFCGMAVVIRRKTSVDSAERIAETIKWAAWSLYFLLSLHPYSDGNGRISRLLCNYVLSSILPVPIPVYNVYSPTSRTDYVKALKTARQCPCNPNKNPITCLSYSQILVGSNPQLIATMVLESCYAACDQFQKRVAKTIPDILNQYPLNFSPMTPGIVIESPSFPDAMDTQS